MDVLTQLEAAGSVLVDKHFVYTSGKHGSAYINCDPLFPDTALVAAIADEMVKSFAGEVDTIAAPATGGIVLSILCANALNQRGDRVAGIWADKSGDDFVFERLGFVDQIKGKRVLVVEDLLNTGGSVRKVCDLVKELGGDLVGASVIANRGNVDATGLGVERLTALVDVEMSVFEADSCELCEAKKPIVANVGHGAGFKEANPGYAGGYIEV